MSDFDLFEDYDADQPAMLEEQKPRPTRKKGGFAFFDIIAGIFALATIAFCVGTFLLIQNPMQPYNPFPPDTPQPEPTIFLLPGGEIADVPTWTPSPSITAGPTATRAATATPTGTAKATATGITALPGATNTLAVFPFTLQGEVVTYVRNATEDACAWQSIAGQVFDLNGEPIIQLPIQVTGDKGFDDLVFSGSETRFGASGYEVFLSDTPVEAEYIVQLFSTTGMPLSERVVVRTLESCDRNVAIANFVQNHEISR
jgi:hypothetical protein